MQKSKRNAIRKGRKSRKIRRFTKRRIVKGGGDNHQNIQKDNEFKKTIDLYQQEQRQEAIRREIMLRQAQEQDRQRAEEIRQSDLRRQTIVEERQRAEERRRTEERQGNQQSALSALFGLP